MMHNRVYRYNKPEADVLLDILNFSNRASFRTDQLVFKEPLSIDHTKTKITVTASEKVNWQGEVELEYNRYDLGTTFSRNPLVIDVDNVDDDSLLRGILDQFKVLFEPHAMIIVRTPLNMAMDNNLLGDIEYEDIIREFEPQPDRDGIYNFVLKARTNSFIWVGETPLLVRRTAQLIDRSIATKLGIRQYLVDTRDNKIPIELIYDIDHDASKFGKVISKDLHTGDLITEVSPFLNVARNITGDNWVARPVKADFNLYGSRILYNGYNVGEYATGNKEYSHILVVSLSHLCLNLKGVWTIQYNDPTVFKYDHCRIDRYTPVDL
jgi:hypothetical protein